MAGFWASRGVFQLRSDDARVGGFLAIALGVLAGAISITLLQAVVGLPDLSTPDGAGLFVVEALVIVALGIVVAWLARRTVFAFGPGDETRIRSYLALATALSAGLLVFAVLRLLFSPTGYFSTLDGGPESAFPGLNLSGLAVADPLGLIIDLVTAAVVAVLAWRWDTRGTNARLFPVWVAGLTTGLVAAAMSAPISAGVFGGVTGSGVDALVALFRTLGLNVFQSAFAQGLVSDPLDKTISYTVVYVILMALPITVRTMYSRGEATVAD
jgi:hypothetical protein